MKELTKYPKTVHTDRVQKNSEAMWMSCLWETRKSFREAIGDLAVLGIEIPENAVAFLEKKMFCPDDFMKWVVNSHHAEIAAANHYISD